MTGDNRKTLSPKRSNCSGSRGRHHPSPLPGGTTSIVIKSPRHCCRGGNPVLNLLPTPALVILPLPSSSPQRESRVLVVIHTVGEWRSYPGSRRASSLPYPCWRIVRALDTRCGEDDGGQRVCLKMSLFDQEKSSFCRFLHTSRHFFTGFL